VTQLDPAAKFIIDAAPAPQSAYAQRYKIYPKLAHGKFRSVKWAVMVVTLGIYYLLPWIRWERGPNLPDQAFLLDFANQRLFFGPIEIWAQELYYITGVLVVSALGLFLVTAVAGRMWCGYACPQTVWTDLMITVERFWQGDRNARMRLDAGPWTLTKIWRKAGTHATWLLIAVATGGVFVFYFRDAPTLWTELWSGEASPVAYAFLAIFTFTTYVLGGFAREQVCIYMCPWPRIQAAMFDSESLLVSYRGYRGEPRGPHKKGQSWGGRGDCVDCKACIAVCPTGIDIRDGAQMECIQCALCIDACNDIMYKLERPTGLIAYETFRNSAIACETERAPVRLVRPRTVLYSALIALVVGIMGWAFAMRADVEISVIEDRNPLFVRLSDGGIRNGYTLKILNMMAEPRSFEVALDGLNGATMWFAGDDSHGARAIAVDVEPDRLREIKVFVSQPADTVSSGLTGFDFTVRDLAGSESGSAAADFYAPEN
jgi:cytochrome c oxidase accessory protein FixG